MKKDWVRRLLVTLVIGNWPVVLNACNSNEDAAGGSSGNTGTDGGAPLIDQVAEPPGSNCPSGGLAIHLGTDQNQNGTLEPNEVTSTAYVCGAAGKAALVLLDPEPTGPNCPAGGTAIKAGVDPNGNGTLEPNEVTSTAYVCSAAGKAALVLLDPEPPGPNCPAAGTAIKAGVDTNGNGTLEASEVTSTSYACNAPPLGGSGILQGSFTIHNSLDVAFLQQFTEVTGDLAIDAPGLKAVSLPVLTKVGKSIYNAGNGAPDLATLGLPALKSVGDVQLVADSLGTLELPALQTVQNELNVSGLTLANVKLPALISTKAITVSAPGPLSVSMPLVTSAEINLSGVTVLDAPVLSSSLGVHITQGQTKTPISLPALTTTGQLIVDGVSKLTAPKLTSSSGPIRIRAFSGIDLPSVNTIPSCGLSNYEVPMFDAGAGDISLPGLLSIGCEDGLASFETTGALIAPGLVTVKNGMQLRKLSSLSLSSLKQVGFGFWVHDTTLVSLDLPALTSATMTLGKGASCGVGTNSLLTKVNAPNWKAGQVQFFGNPLFPQCRADALIAQVGSGLVHCPLASGPCP
ncbi:MAG: hypothetical protein HYZ29_01260 [Myxococcales bacterium]|nr:hypothetical protein [Myxococcales bacterium]